MLRVGSWKRFCLAVVGCSWLTTGVQGCGTDNGDTPGEGTGGAKSSGGAKGSGGAKSSGGASNLPTGGRASGGQANVAGHAGQGQSAGGAGGESQEGGAAGNSAAGSTPVETGGSVGSGGTAGTVGSGGTAGTVGSGGIGFGGTTVGSGGTAGTVSSGTGGEAQAGAAGAAGADAGAGAGGTGIGPIDTAICGNGVVELDEVCDLGARNGIVYGDGSGCTTNCTQEPTCRDSGGTPRACSSACGDGNLDPGETCDDGNLRSGDGCSNNCAVEPHYSCHPETSSAATGPCSSDAQQQCLSLGVTYRDFDGSNLATGHPDFMYLGPIATGGGGKVTCIPNASGANLFTLPAVGNCPKTDATDPCRGLVGATLGTDGKPVLGSTSTCKCTFTDWDATGILTGAAGQKTCTIGPANVMYLQDLSVKTIQSADSFKQWFSDSALSTKVTSTLELGRVAGSSNEYRFSSSNGRTIYDDLHDIWLTSRNIPSTSPLPIASSLSSGFFPLEDTSRPKLCNLWPYWTAGLGSANCVANTGNPIKQQWDPRGWQSGGASGPQTGETLGVTVKPVTGVMRNFYFTSEVHYPFRYVGGERITFQGDDDAWIFVNGHLVLDLGGTHERMKGVVALSATSTATWNISIQNASTGAETQIPGALGSGTVSGLELEVGKVYDIAVFHADRQPRESNYVLSLAGFTRSRSVCEPL